MSSQNVQLAIDMQIVSNVQPARSDRRNQKRNQKVVGS